MLLIQVFALVFLIFGSFSLGFIYWFQDGILYQTGQTQPWRYPENNTSKNLTKPNLYDNMQYENLRLVTQDKIKLNGWFIYPKNDLENRNFKVSQTPTIVYLHENTGNIGIRMPFYHHLVTKLHVNVLAMAYRGYSNSNGTASESGLKTDGREIMKFLMKPESINPIIAAKINPRLIYLYGRGIGAGVAYHMAEYKPEIIRGLIIENAFTSIPDLVDYQFNIIKHIKQYIVTNFWYNDQAAEKMHMPIMYIAGSKDKSVPEDHTRKLHALSKKAAFTELYIVKDAGHSDCWFVGGNEYISKLKNFIDKTVKKYELEIFDEWAAGAKFDKTSDLLEQESEEAKKVKITTTRLPPGAIEKIQEKHKAKQKRVAGTIGIENQDGENIKYPEIKNENVNDEEAKELEEGLKMIQEKEEL